MAILQGNEASGKRIVNRYLYGVSFQQPTKQEIKSTQAYTVHKCDSLGNWKIHQIYFGYWKLNTDRNKVFGQRNVSKNESLRCYSDTKQQYQDSTIK